ncbi:protein GRINL1A [Conger conger]|uniref:protein GRINL1A n=1 Tax=Conger conger TaxID=82655 RepID=UPI002A5AB446|nr:protein GRINL1A [Conger conger]
MSSSWTERQGYIGDLLGKSKDELCDILYRQEKLLSNKRFVQSLPDKGRKITDFVQRLRLALVHHEEEERRRDMLSSVRTEFQSKYQQALSQRQHGNPTDTPNVPLSETSFSVPTRQSMNRQDFLLKAPPADNAVSAADLNEPAVVSMETASDGRAELSAAAARTEEKDLVEALGKVTLTDGAAAPSRLSGAESSDCTGDDPFRGKPPQKKPHYIDVLEKSEKSAATRKPKFKPNHLPQKFGGSPTGSTPGQSPGVVPQAPGVVPQPPGVVPQAPGVVPQPPGVVPQAPGVVPQPPGVVPQPPGVVPQPPGVVPQPPGVVPQPPGVVPQPPGVVPQLSADARRERDRKHLDDITAAKLPPLHYSPARLLSLEESVALQQEHNRKHKDLQAKMAAQKLSGRLGVGMTTYRPDVGQEAGYRESHADEAKLSSDED